VDGRRLRPWPLAAQPARPPKGAAFVLPRLTVSSSAAPVSGTVGALGRTTIRMRTAAILHRLLCLRIGRRRPLPIDPRCCDFEHRRYWRRGQDVASCSGPTQRLVSRGDAGIVMDMRGGGGGSHRFAAAVASAQRTASGQLAGGSWPDVTAKFDNTVSRLLAKAVPVNPAWRWWWWCWLVVRLGRCLTTGPGRPMHAALSGCVSRPSSTASSY